MKNILVTFAAAANMVLPASAVVVFSENFDNVPIADGVRQNFGVNVPITGTLLEGSGGVSPSILNLNDPANAALAGAFTSASGNVVTFSETGLDFAALRFDVALALDTGDPSTVFDNTSTFTYSFDLYIPSDLGRRIADFGPRFRSVSTNGNGVNNAGSAVTAAGVTAFTISGVVGDFNNSVAGNEEIIDVRPFIGLDQRVGALADFAFIDNIVFEINPVAVPEPSSALLLGLSGLLCVVRRRR